MSPLLSANESCIKSKIKIVCEIIKMSLFHVMTIRTKLIVLYHYITGEIKAIVLYLNKTSRYFVFC